MRDKTIAILSYLKYQRNAKTKYYLHSPFFYKFFLQILSEGKDESNLKPLIQYHSLLKQNNHSIIVNDYGAKKGVYQKKISAIASNVTITPKYGKVLYRIANYFRPNLVIELGTSLGISSSFLALGFPRSVIKTFEGATEIANIARQTHRNFSINNTEIIEGNFDDTFPKFVKNIASFDIAYIDGNHTYSATMRYFHLLLEKTNTDSVIIFDDIYWSSDMKKAWEEIKANPKVSCSIDIYKMGFVFFHNEMKEKQHEQLRY